MNLHKQKRLKTLLEKTLDDFVEVGEHFKDAIEPALRFTEKQDQEFAAFICAVLAYGNVKQIIKSARRVLDPLGGCPVNTLKKMSDREIERTYENWCHRFNRPEDLAALLKMLKRIYSEYPSLEDFWCDREFQSAKELIENFVDLFTLKAQEWKVSLPQQKSFWYFFPRPSGGSACKRLNLYLRWMVGKGPVDFGIWVKVSSRLLIIPMDTHLLKQARSLKLTRRKMADWKTAMEVTEKLKLLDPEDPTRFDFALCHLGIQGKILSRI